MPSLWSRASAPRSSRSASIPGAGGASSAGADRGAGPPPPIRVPGDEAHNDNSNIRSYDIGQAGLASARFIRLTGTAGGSDAWFEARYQLIRLLAETDPDRARLVMRQHKALNPSYGPEPWGVKLRVLDLRLGTGSSDVADEREVRDGR